MFYLQMVEQVKKKPFLLCTALYGDNWTLLYAYSGGSSKTQCFLFPSLCIVRNIKPTDFFGYSIPRDPHGLRNVDGKTRKFWSSLHILSKTWSNFMFLKISPIQSMSKHKARIVDEMSTNLTNILLCESIKKDHHDDM